MSSAAVLQRYYNTEVNENLVTYQALVLLDCPELTRFLGKNEMICKFALKNVVHMKYQPVWVTCDLN